MDTGETLVECEFHGFQQETFVCQHLMSSLDTKIKVGFNSAPNNERNKRPDAWCDNCEQKRIECGGEWNDQSEAFAGVKLLCGSCYDQIKQLNISAKKWWMFWQ